MKFSICVMDDFSGSQSIISESRGAPEAPWNCRLATYRKTKPLFLRKPLWRNSCFCICRNGLQQILSAIDSALFPKKTNAGRVERVALFCWPAEVYRINPCHKKRKIPACCLFTICISISWAAMKNRSIEPFNQIAIRSILIVLAGCIWEISQDFTVAECEREFVNIHPSLSY